MLIFVWVCGVQSMTARGLSSDFWKFWAGQSISNLGNSVTFIAVPLLIYKLTGSALDLGLASASQFVPYVLFGLVIGAWVDRVDRKRLMILADIGRAVVIGAIPLLALFDQLNVWWIYALGFVNATISIGFDSAQFAAIPSLVPTDDLVTANGRIQASFSVATVVGPLLAGAMIAVMPVETIFAIDAASFLVSALLLSVIARKFNTSNEIKTPTSLRTDVAEGLRYVWNHPVLRNISIMMALVNFFSSTVYAQLVLFAKEQLDANDSRVGLLFAADAAGVVLISLLAGRLRRRWSFGTIALGSLMIQGVLNVIFAYVTNYWAAMFIWALFGGFGVLFNINSGSLRQAIVPNHLLGRVMSVAGVLALSAIPVGTLLGGIAIERTGDVALVYAVIGVMTFAIAFAFRFTALGDSDQFVRDGVE